MHNGYKFCLSWTVRQKKLSPFVRDGEHLTAAMADVASFFFYLVYSYPSTQSPRSEKREKRGTFESLKQLVSSGFDRAQGFKRAENGF